MEPMTIDGTGGLQKAAHPHVLGGHPGHAYPDAAARGDSSQRSTGSVGGAGGGIGGARPGAASPPSPPSVLDGQSAAMLAARQQQLLRRQEEELLAGQRSLEDMRAQIARQMEMRRQLLAQTEQLAAEVDRREAAAAAAAGAASGGADSGAATPGSGLREPRASSASDNEGRSSALAAARQLQALLSGMPPEQRRAYTAELMRHRQQLLAAGASGAGAADVAAAALEHVQAIMASGGLPGFGASNGAPGAVSDDLFGLETPRGLQPALPPQLSARLSHHGPVGQQYAGAATSSDALGTGADEEDGEGLLLPADAPPPTPGAPAVGRAGLCDDLRPAGAPLTPRAAAPGRGSTCVWDGAADADACEVRAVVWDMVRETALALGENVPGGTTPSDQCSPNLRLPGSGAPSCGHTRRALPPVSDSMSGSCGSPPHAGSGTAPCGGAPTHGAPPAPCGADDDAVGALLLGDDLGELDAALLDDFLDFMGEGLGSGAAPGGMQGARPTAPPPPLSTVPSGDVPAGLRALDAQLMGSAAPPAAVRTHGGQYGHPAAVHHMAPPHQSAPHQSQLAAAVSASLMPGAPHNGHLGAPLGSSGPSGDLHRTAGWNHRRDVPPTMGDAWEVAGGALTSFGLHPAHLAAPHHHHMGAAPARAAVGGAQPHAGAQWAVQCSTHTVRGSMVPHASPASTPFARMENQRLGGNPFMPTSAAAPLHHAMSAPAPGYPQQHAMQHHQMQPQQPQQQQQQPRRVTIKLTGSVTLRPTGSGAPPQMVPNGSGGFGHARSASAMDMSFGASAPGADREAGNGNAAAPPLARSASEGLSLRKRGSGSAAAVAGLRLRPSKSQRLGQDEADSAASAPRGVRRPIAPPPYLTTPAAAYERGRPSFADIVSAGVFPPGLYEFSVGGHPVTAQVLATGTIIYAGETHGSISAFALAAARSRNPQRQACDGWREVRLAGHKLEAWRQAFLRGTDPPDAPQKGAIQQQAIY